MKTVLFLGVGNSIRTQMAEAILRHRAGDRFKPLSAGLVPQAVHPLTRRVLAEIGIDASHLEAKGLRSFLGHTTVDTAIIVSQPQEPDSPRIYPFACNVLKWPMENPTLMDGNDNQKLNAFRQVRDRIDKRVRDWLDTDSDTNYAAPSKPEQP